MDRSQVAIVIPAYNEESTIAKIVSQVIVYGLVIVVNDASTDGTQKNAELAGATVINHLHNLGYDEALNTGFRTADEQKCKYILTFDADGQHDVSLIEKYIDLLDNLADLVLGVRLKKARFAEKLFAFITNLFYDIKDPLCGMKGYKIEVYKELGHFDSYGSIGSELALFAVKKKYRFEQMQISIQERKDIPRFGRMLKANLKILRAMIYFIYKSII